MQSTPLLNKTEEKNTTHGFVRELCFCSQHHTCPPTVYSGDVQQCFVDVFKDRKKHPAKQAVGLQKHTPKHPHK